MADDPRDADTKNLAAKWSQNVPGVLRFLFISLMPPMIVIAVNSILIFFIHLLGRRQFTQLIGKIRIDFHLTRRQS
jgi:hypothetical protein